MAILFLPSFQNRVSGVSFKELAICFLRGRCLTRSFFNLFKLEAREVAASININIVRE